METEIKKGDIVFHMLSKLLFRCENSKHEKWMNENKNYRKTELKTIDYERWKKKELYFFILESRK